MTDSLVIVQSFNNRVEAELAKGALDAAGIPAVVRADDCGGMRPELQFSGGAQVLVENPLLERAREALKDFALPSDD